MSITIVPEPADAVAPFRPRRRGAGWRALSLTVWLVGAALLLGAIAFALYSAPTDTQRARRAAMQLLPASLDDGERVERTAYVVQRNWWDYFRDTHGVLAATDRRLVFVGVPPQNVLVPADGAPRVLAWELPYDTLLVARRARVFLGAVRGARLRLGRAERVMGDGGRRESAALDTVLAVVARRQRETRDQAARDRAAQEAADSAAAQPVFHVVRAGEALDVLSRAYGTPVDTIKALNGLTSDRVRIGATLMVRRHAGNVSP